MNFRCVCCKFVEWRDESESFKNLWSQFARLVDTFKIDFFRANNLRQIYIFFYNQMSNQYRALNNANCVIWDRFQIEHLFFVQLERTCVWMNDDENVFVLDLAHKFSIFDIERLTTILHNLDSECCVRAPDALMSILNFHWIADFFFDVHNFRLA